MKDKGLEIEINRIIKKQPVRILKLVQVYIKSKKKVFKLYTDQEQENYLHEIWSTDKSLKSIVRDFLVDMMNNRELCILDKYQNKFWSKFHEIMDQFLIKNRCILILNRDFY